MTLLAKYQAAVACGEINDSPLQREVLMSMQRVVDDFDRVNSSWLSRLFSRPIQGIYLYGSVGVGKTYLVDMLYDQVEGGSKSRFHFHHFMQQVDAQLRKLQGKKDPLLHLAQSIAKTTRLLCFDEFLVHDVAYAMILAKLLPELMNQGVVLVVSSNTKPDDLYLNGVQRDRFLPVISAIKAHCQILHLSEQVDYRLGRNHLVEAYLFPLNTKNQSTMERQFAALNKKIEESGVISIQNREIPFLKCGDRSIWFDFKRICDLPRSQLDYLEIAEHYDTIYVSNVPVLTEKHTTQAIMFVHFIDVMYDRGVNVILSAEVPAAQLYLKGELLDTFKRTLSRLEEMQSVDYLSRHPRRAVQQIT